MDRIATVTGLVAWAREQGLPLDVGQIFHPATVNRYAVTPRLGVSVSRCLGCDASLPPRDGDDALAADYPDGAVRAAW
ncbi:hypothetical protein BDB13_5544 [Rhodococcus sp. OK302]|nr:hypothetical protein BDB13_5544 [Rhodococcus sp. OK302]